jgi:hypothetical protein
VPAGLADEVILAYMAKAKARALLQSGDIGRDTVQTENSHEALETDIFIYSYRNRFLNH